MSEATPENKIAEISKDNSAPPLALDRTSPAASKREEAPSDATAKKASADEAALEVGALPEKAQVPRPGSIASTSEAAMLPAEASAQEPGQLRTSASKLEAGTLSGIAKLRKELAAIRKAHEPCAAALEARDAEIQKLKAHLASSTRSRPRRATPP